MSFVNLKLKSKLLGSLVAILAANQLIGSLSAYESPENDTRLTDKTCNAKQVDNDAGKIVCVCRENDCPKFEFDWPQKSGDAVVVTSSKSGRRFQVGKLSTSGQERKPSDLINIDLGSEHQTVLGWGGAFTDAATENIMNLSMPVANELFESYYGSSGLQYNFGRVTIAGSDFSTRPYSYDDSPGPDYELRGWSLQKEDREFKIPSIKRAMELVEKRGDQLKLFASPWSPPKWMKDNNSFVRGHLKDENSTYRAYARYLVNFYKEYQQNGIKFWGATVQNEPISAFMPVYFFNSLEFGSLQMTKFISQHLGPALKAAGFTKDNFKLMIGDDNLGMINYHVPEVMKNQEAAKYISGLAFHWYTSGSIVPYDSLLRVIESIKDKIEFVIMTEACTGSSPGDKKVDLGSWERGEKYATDIIEDFQRGTGAWIDWNIALNMQGGPNWSNNFVDSPIIVNAEAGEFYKQPMYYALGHFSRFFRPGFVRVASGSKGSHFTLRHEVKAIAAVDKKEGHLVITLLNKSNISRNVQVSILAGKTSSETKTPTFVVPMERKSITSIVMKL